MSSVTTAYPMQGDPRMDRYLTPAEKAGELAAWTDNDGADEGTRPLMERLNAIDGVCTVQSCIGHVRPSKIDGATLVENGHVELRLDEACTRRFYAGMPRLRALPGVDDVAISWRTPYQVCNVSFQPGGIELVVELLVEILAPALGKSEGASREQEATCL